MEFWSWLTGDQTDSSDLPSPSPVHEPPEFLNIRRSKPVRPTLSKEDSTDRSYSGEGLTPLESQLKEIVLDVYSDKIRSRSSTTAAQTREEKHKTKEGTEVSYQDFHNFSSASDTVLHSEQRDSVSKYLKALQPPEQQELFSNVVRSKPDGSDSPALAVSRAGSQDIPGSAHLPSPEDLSAGINVLAITSQRRETTKTEHTEKDDSYSGREASRTAYPLSDNSFQGMSDTHSAAHVDVASSFPAFSADDLDLNTEDAESTPLPHSLGGLPYAGAVQSHNTANMQQRTSYLYSSSNTERALPDVESSPGLLYSFSDSSTSRPSTKNESRSGVIDSFGFTPQLYHSAIAKPKSKAPPSPLSHPVRDKAQASPPHTPVVDGHDDSNVVDGDGVDGSSGISQDITDTRSPDDVLDNWQHRRDTPLAQEEFNDHDDVSSREKTPTPESVPVYTTLEPTPLTDSTESSSYYRSEPAGGNMHLSAEGGSELTESSEDESPVTVGVPYLPRMDSDAAETGSVVSVQQLAEDYLKIEPADFDNVIPLAEGQCKIPIALPITTTKASKLKCESSPNDPPSKQASREFPSPAIQSKQLPSPIKVPAHISASQRFERKSTLPSAGRTVSASSDVSESPVPSHTQPSLLKPSSKLLLGGEGSCSDHERELEDQLAEEQKARMYLKGQLEALTEEYESALGDRSGLLSRLSRAEAELAEVTSALEKEKTTKAAALIEGDHSTTKAVPASHELKDALAREKKVISDLQGSLAKEKHKSEKLERDLEDVKQTISETETALSDLQEKLRCSQADMDKKADESEERLCKLSTLEASYDALEKNKQWLHEQLQDGLKAKLKLQEELREAKASSIAQEIKCNQIQKENSLLQQQVNALQKGVLQDKEKLVSQLEEIEAGVLSREDLCSNLVAEKGQLEDLVKRKDETVSHLNFDLGRAQVKQEELQEQIDEATRENVEQTRKTDSLERENRHLAKKLKDSVGDLEARESDYKELEKVKGSLQDRLRQADVEMAGKDGIIQSLNEARDILQREVDLVNQARESVEKELEDTKCEVAELEAEVKSTLNRCKEKDFLLRGSAESQSSLGDQQEAMQALLAAKDRKIREKEDTIKNLEGQIGDLVKEFGALQANFQSIASESGTVNDSIAEKDRVISHLASLKDRSEEELGSLREESQELRDKVAQLQHEKAHLQGQVEGSVQHEDYQKSLQDKTEVQAELNAEKLKHQQDQIKSQAKTNRLERELKEARKSASGAQRDLQRTLDRNSEDMNKLKEAKHQLESDLRELEEKLRRTLEEKERSRGVHNSSKPSEEHLALLKTKCDQLMRENQTLAEQLQQETEQRKEVERASGLVAGQLKQNSERQKKELLQKNREQSLDVERLRGRLVGMHTTQVTLREHAVNLEVALAKKEGDVVKLSAQVQKLIEEKAMDEQEVKAQITAMEDQVKGKQAEVTDCQYKVQDEKVKVEGLEREVAKLEAEISAMKAELSRKKRQGTPGLKEQVTSLSLEKEALQSDLSYFKSQLLIAKTSADSAKREIADKVSQVEILERQLAIAESRYQQADEEVKQLKEHMRSGDARFRATGQVGNVGGGGVRKEEWESSAMEETGTRKKRRGKGSGPDQLFDTSLSSISGGVDDVDHPQTNQAGEHVQQTTIIIVSKI